MTRSPSCEDVRALAPEVALGIASGEERASVLAHVRKCGDCRRLLEDLADSSDALLLLAPQREPSGGFESAVLARIAGRRRTSRRRVVLGIAAAALAVAVGGGAVLWITSDDRTVASHYRAALAEANGEYFGVVPLHTPGGAHAGHLFLYEGSPSWIFFVLDDPLEAREYTIHLDTRSGGRIELDVQAHQEPRVAWGSDIPVGLRAVKAVRVVDTRNAVGVEAIFPES